MKHRRKTDELPLYPPLVGPLNRLGPIVTDPQGSYTGRPAEAGEVPVQDADDL